MANNITGNPWYLDTTGVIVKTRFKFDGGIFTPTAPGSVILLQDASGRVVVSLTADSVGANVDIPRMGWINGLTVITLAGHVVLYVGNK